MQVYGIPADGSLPFLMFIADLGDEATRETRAHSNAHRTRKLYAQPLIAYELRGKGEPRRFNFIN